MANMLHPAAETLPKRCGISFGKRAIHESPLRFIMFPPPKRCGISFVIRDAREVVPYGYAASYPPLPPKRRGGSFVARKWMRFNAPL